MEQRGQLGDGLDEGPPRDGECGKFFDSEYEFDTRRDLPCRDNLSDLYSDETDRDGNCLIDDVFSTDSILRLAFKFMDRGLEMELCS